MPKEKIDEKYRYKYDRCLKISELIKELQAIKKEHGDLPVGHITNGLTMYISQKYRPVGCDGNDIFPTIRISNLRYWEKDSPKIAIIDNYDWSLLKEREEKLNEK